MTVTSSLTTFEKRTASCDCSRTIEHLQQRLADERARCERIATDLQLQEEQGRALLRQIASLKRELTKRERASVSDEKVQKVWDTYVAVVAVRKDVVLDEARRKMIRDRVRDIEQAPNVDEDPVERLCRALHGLAKRPYVKAGGGRTGVRGPGATRYAGLQHALRDMQTVETCIGYLEPEPVRPRGLSRPDPFERPCDRVLAELDRLELKRSAAWGSAGKWMAQCPAHDDRESSLSIREGDDGRALLNCFAGCHVSEVVDALGLSLSDLFARAAA